MRSASLDARIGFARLTSVCILEAIEEDNRVRETLEMSIELDNQLYNQLDEMQRNVTAFAENDAGGWGKNHSLPDSF